MEFLLCADLIDAQRAFQMGLLNAVVAEDALLDSAFEYAARITKNAPLAVQATKRSVLEGLKLDMREAYRNEAAHLQGGLRHRGRQGGPARIRREAPAAVVRFLMGATDDARQLCVIGAAQHTVRDADAPEPLVSWEQRAREAAAVAGADDSTAADRFTAGGVLPELALRRPRRQAGGGAGRRTAASALLGNRRHDPAGPGQPDRGGDAAQGSCDLALICSAEALATAAGGQEERPAVAVEPSQVLAVPMGAAPSVRDQPRGAAGLGDVSAVGHRPPGQTRRVAGGRRRGGGGDDGRDERCRGSESARLAAGRAERGRGGNRPARRTATWAGRTPNTRSR